MQLMDIYKYTKFDGPSILNSVTCNFRISTTTNYRQEAVVLFRLVYHNITELFGHSYSPPDFKNITHNALPKL